MRPLLDQQFASIIARRRISAGPTGSPPVSAASFGQQSTANLNTMNIGGATTPANTKAVIASFGTFLQFNVAEPQTITSLICSYAGQSMPRVDTYDNNFFASRFHTWTFALLSPALIPSSGTITMTAAFSTGKVEIQTGIAHMVTHDTDLQFEVLDENRLTSASTSVTNTYTHSANSLLLSVTGFKGQGTIAGAGPLWIEQQRRSAFDSFPAASGTLLLETKQVVAAGVDSATTTTSASNLASGSVYSLRGI